MQPKKGRMTRAHIESQKTIIDIVTGKKATRKINEIEIKPCPTARELLKSAKAKPRRKLA